MHRKKKISKKREQEIAREFGTHPTFGSGATWHDKADVNTELFLIEDKYTNKDIYTLNLRDLLALENAAKVMGKIPLFRFGFTKTKNDYAMFRAVDVQVDAPAFIVAKSFQSLGLKDKEIDSFFNKTMAREEMYRLFPNIDIVFLHKGVYRFKLFEWRFCLENYNHIIGLV